MGLAGYPEVVGPLDDENHLVFMFVDMRRDAEAPLYASTAPDIGANLAGPFAKGHPLDLTLGVWQAGTGGVLLSCWGDRGTVEASFEGLVPGAVYTLWHVYSSAQFPVGAENAFVTDAHGTGRYQARFEGCLPHANQGSGGALALVYHSGPPPEGTNPGAFGKNSHLQLVAPFPELETATDYESVRRWR